MKCFILIPVLLLASCAVHSDAEFKAVVAERDTLKQFPVGTPGVSHVFNHTDAPPVMSWWGHVGAVLAPIEGVVSAIWTAATTTTTP